MTSRKRIKGRARKARAREGGLAQGTNGSEQRCWHGFEVKHRRSPILQKFVALEEKLWKERVSSLRFLAQQLKSSSSQPLDSMAVSKSFDCEKNRIDTIEAIETLYDECPEAFDVPENRELIRSFYLYTGTDTILNDDTKQDDDIYKIQLGRG